MNPAPADRLRSALVVLALFLAATLPYLATLAYPFVGYDDPDYVTRNPMVQGGLTLEGLRWAFTTAHASNWHPLTWLAHMLDVELYAGQAGGHHASSVLLHGLNAVLCFLALRALTARADLAAAVALLFAVHPLRVESVAWISERKDVLAGTFFFLLLHAHALRVRRGGARLYVLELLCFALGLLAKPMLVSAPLVLLVLDLWVLGRRTLGLRRLALEFLPFALLAARPANAPRALWTYLAHLAWPRELAYFYPHRARIAPQAPAFDARTWAAVGGLIALLWATLGLRRRAPLVAAGLAWFLVMLLPVIGLVQVGEQALADRYTYLPTVGVTLSLVAALAAWAQGAQRRRVAGAALVLVALALAVRTRAQVATWRDSRTLYAHALAVTDDNYAAWAALGKELHEAGERDEARRAFEAALAIHPSYAPALYALGLLAQEEDRRAEALDFYRRAIAAQPGHGPAELNLGGLLAREGDLVGAARCFESVLAREPEQPEARTNLAQLLLAAGERAAAQAELERVLASHPAHDPAWYLLGELHERDGRHREALAALEHALDGARRLDAARLCAWILASASEPELRDPARALALARELAAAGRDDVPALEARAATLAANGEFERAATLLEAAAGQLTGGAAAALMARAERYRRGQLFLHPH